MPDQHAAFGINKAMAASRGEGAGGRGRNGERNWRDFDSLNDLMRGVGLGDGTGWPQQSSGRGGVSNGSRIAGGSRVPTNKWSLQQRH